MTDNKAYLEYALHLKRNELEIQRQLLDWLPEEIFDSHTHASLPEHFEKIDQAIYSHPMSTFHGFSIDDSLTIQQCLFPGKTIHSMRFAFPFNGVNLRRANEYLAAEIPEFDKFAFCGIPDDIEYTLEGVQNSQVKALKMYPWYSLPPSLHIYDFFPEVVLEEAQSAGIPIILHLPNYISECQNELVNLLNDFPSLKVVVAHLGLCESIMPGLEDAYRTFSPYENLFWDSAMNRSVDVIKLAFSIIGPSRILYGSDEPLNLVRIGTYNNPKLGWRYITEYPYHWIDTEEHQEYRHLAQDLTLGAFEQLRSLKQAIEEYFPKNLQPSVALSVFQKNAQQLFNI